MVVITSTKVRLRSGSLSENELSSTPSSDPVCSGTFLNSFFPDQRSLFGHPSGTHGDPRLHPTPPYGVTDAIFFFLDTFTHRPGLGWDTSPTGSSRLWTVYPLLIGSILKPFCPSWSFFDSTVGPPALLGFSLISTHVYRYPPRHLAALSPGF